jgi:hypothetical protein
MTEEMADKTIEGGNKKSWEEDIPWAKVSFY